MLFWVLLAFVLTGCGRETSGGAESPAPAPTPATAPLDYLSAQGHGKRRSENVVALAEVQKALREFQAAEDRWPTELDELVRTGLLAQVPKVPAGQRLAYDPATGSVRVVPVVR